MSKVTPAGSGRVKSWRRSLSLAGEGDSGGLSNLESAGLGAGAWLDQCVSLFFFNSVKGSLFFKYSNAQSCFYYPLPSLTKQNRQTFFFKK